MTNLDLTSAIHTAQTAAHNQHLPAAESQSQPPAYSTLAPAANEYNSSTTAQGEIEEKSALTAGLLSDEGTDQYKRFY